MFFELVAGPSPTSQADADFDAWLALRGTSRAALDTNDWLSDDVPWVAGPLWRRYFVRTTALRLLTPESRSTQQ